MSDTSPEGFTLDAGALIALERGSALMLNVLEGALAGATEVAIPRTVIAQVWRGTPRQTHLARLVNAGNAGWPAVILDELTDRRARQIGYTIGTGSHHDIVDVHVALVAGERGHTVLTSDEADIAKVDPALVIVRV